MARQTTKRSKQSDTAGTPQQINAAERHDLIALRAYLHVEGRGFQGGDPVHDWLQAEACRFNASSPHGFVKRKNSCKPDVPRCL